jgi:hypothetical protein
VITSRVGLGDGTRRLGPLPDPEEVDPPQELRDLQTFHDAGLAKTRALPPAERDGFVRAVVDPLVNALHRALLGRRRTLRAEIRGARAALVTRSLAEGPQGAHRPRTADPPARPGRVRCAPRAGLGARRPGGRRALGPSRRQGRRTRGMRIVAAAWLLVASLLPSPPAHATELRVWGMGREGEVLRDLVPEFERAHPGVRVRVQQIPWSAAHEKLLTAFVGGALPDVLQVGNTWIPELVALDAVAPVDDELASVRDDLFPGILDTNVVDGRTWGMPWYADTRLLFYRDDLVTRAGGGAPPATWADWLALLERIARRAGPDDAALLLPVREWQLPVVLALQRGAPLLTEDGTRGAFASEPARGAFAFYLDLFTRGVARRDAATQLTNVYQDFAAGRFAFYVTGPWNLTEFATRLPADVVRTWRTAPMPAPAPGGRARRSRVARASSWRARRASRRSRARSCAGSSSRRRNAASTHSRATCRSAAPRGRRATS